MSISQGQEDHYKSEIGANWGRLSQTFQQTNQPSSPCPWSLDSGAAGGGYGGGGGASVFTMKL